MDIKAGDVKKLREKTGAGMLDCKKALQDAQGDFVKAEKLLKEMGLAAVAKRSGRATENGRIFASQAKNRAALLELGCETDFVAMNKDFITLGNTILNIILEKNLTETTPELEDGINRAIGTIKENIVLKRFTTMNIENAEIVSSYIHGEGSIGVLVKLKGDSPETVATPRVKEFAFDCALHIAAFNPLYLDQASVDPAYLEEQEDIFAKQAAALGKPEKVVQGIVKGKLNKHLAEICLLDQGFVKDDKTSVQKVKETVAAEAKGSLEIADYCYYKVGDE